MQVTDASARPPERVTAETQAGRTPPADLPEGDHAMLVDNRGENPRILRFAAPVGRVLLALTRGKAPSPADSAALAAAGLMPTAG